ncbi:MAG: FIST C-terminal domain-containing protein [Gemmataceae bacterium]|nr:FIST C-terminal domain-containing protein [Gemmataceae bacterium]MDW8266703.1 FIST N-terminal domain-containing protein [Gemmataceae bacterium]
MPFATALSTQPETATAVHEACTAVAGRLPPPVDLALVFFTPQHAADADTLATEVHQRMRPRSLLGCVAEAVVGNDREIEDGPALCVWAGTWRTSVALESFHLTYAETPDGETFLGWPDGLWTAAPEQAVIFLLGDPLSFPADECFRELNTERRGVRVLGGMASGVRGLGHGCLLRDGEVLNQGAVGVLLHGAVRVRTIVSQGCRPIGQHMVITKGHDNVILELGGRSPLDRLREVWTQLGPRDRQLFRRGLHVGRVINEYQGDFQRGDFLVRNVVALDPALGALVLNDYVRVGQTVQFHLRDAATADEDLRALLQLDLSAHERRPEAALLFTCNGRGTRLFDRPHHDVQAIRAQAGPIPIAGFFAQGEFGPVGGQNFIHGFTASVVLFEDD